MPGWSNSFLADRSITVGRYGLMCGLVSDGQTENTGSIGDSYGLFDFLQQIKVHRMQV